MNSLLLITLSLMPMSGSATIFHIYDDEQVIDVITLSQTYHISDAHVEKLYNDFLQEQWDNLPRCSNRELERRFLEWLPSRISRTDILKTNLKVNSYED